MTGAIEAFLYRRLIVENELSFWLNPVPAARLMAGMCERRRRGL